MLTEREKREAEKILGDREMYYGTHYLCISGRLSSRRELTYRQREYLMERQENQRRNGEQR